jgi:tetratricopeptide (TPR) repeat protein
LSSLEQEGLAFAERRFDPRSITPRVESTEEKIAAAYLQRALGASKRGDRDASLALVERARGIAPDFGDVPKIAGFIFGQFGDLYQAEEEFRLAESLNGADENTLLAFAQFLLYQLNGKFDEALSLADRAVAIARVPDTLVVRGRARMFLRNFAGAIDDFEAVIADSGALRKHLLLSFDQAAETCRRAVEFYAADRDPLALAWATRGYQFVLESISKGTFDIRLSKRAMNIVTEVLIHSSDFAWSDAVETFLGFVVDHDLAFVYAQRDQATNIANRMRQYLDSTGKREIVAIDALIAKLGRVVAIEGSPGESRDFGMISRVIDDASGRYGFINSTTGEVLFFPLSELEFDPRVHTPFGRLVNYYIEAQRPGRERRVARSIRLAVS